MTKIGSKIVIRPDIGLFSFLAITHIGDVGGDDMVVMTMTAMTMMTMTMMTMTMMMMMMMT